MAKKELDEELVYVYVFLCELEGTLRGICKVNTNYEGLEEILESWRDIPDKKFEKYCASAKAGIKKLMELEPTLAEGKGILEASVVEKNIVVLKRGNWERQVAVCANADYPVIKRISWSDVYDFGEEWFGVPCSEEYWDAVCEAYDYLDAIMGEWTPLLIGNELIKIQQVKHDAFAFLKNLFMTEEDFYLIIDDKKRKQTIIQIFNPKIINKSLKITDLAKGNLQKKWGDAIDVKWYNVICIEEQWSIGCMLEWNEKVKKIELEMWIINAPIKEEVMNPWEI